jgi:hypothetical protein
MVVVPASIPVTSPVTGPTLAIEVLPLLHPPPVVVLDKVVVSPSHTLVVPVIAAGDKFTVIAFTATQVVGNV